MFEFEKEVVLDNHQDSNFVVPYASPLVHLQDLVNKKRKNLIEPKSVLDNITTSPSPPASTSTLSSHGGADTAAAVAPSSKWPENQETTTPKSNVTLLDPQHFQPPPPPPPPLPPLETVAGNLKCGGINDWENVDSGEDQAMLRWIMGDVEDPSMSLNKMLHATVSGGAPVDFQFNGGFTSLDSGDPSPEIFKTHLQHHQNQNFSPFYDTHLPQFDIKPNLFNTQIVNSPQPKTYNSRSIAYTPSMHNNLNHNHHHHNQQQQHQQEIIDQLFKAAELIQSANNPITAQEILARLNHRLS